MRYCLALSLLLFCILQVAKCQDRKLISGNFQNYSFSQLVKEIESQTDYHFFYDSAEVDSLLININVSRITISRLLNEVLQKTSLHYSIDSTGRVFITNNSIIQTTLPNNFFAPGKTTDSSGYIAEESPSGQDFQKKDKLKISAENKLFEIGIRTNKPLTGKAILSGYVRDVQSGEPIAAASIYLDTPSLMVNTNQYGYYTLLLPKGRHTIKISSSGMQEAKRQVMLYADGKLDVELHEYVASLKTVVVSAEKASNIKGTQMGVSKLNIKQIKQVPALFGETDILKVVLTLPGVTSVGEGSNGLNVRGGSTSQNLILFNDATIYNPSHLFGFFSAFNPDVVKGIELYKSYIPEKFGGRLSSVLDVAIKDGNSKKWSGVAGISPVTSKLTIEGPLQKGKTSIVLGGRTTYSDWLLHNLPNTTYNRSDASFYDLNFRLTHTINSKNFLYLTGYMSRDYFNFNHDTSYTYNNKSANLKWRHIFNDKFSGVLTAGIDKYQYTVSSEYVPVNGYKLAFDINQKNLRADFNYQLNDKHALDFGLTSIYYTLHPGNYQPLGQQSLVSPNVVPQEQALESALYFGDSYSVSSKFSINAGIRYSIYNYLGPHDEYQYVPGEGKSVNTITDTNSYTSGKFIKTYTAPEVRIALKYELSSSSSIKISYNTLHQYIHMLSNTAAISPTDIWKLSDPNIKPQSGQQYSLGYYKNLKSNTIETSIEVYYKTISHYLDYKSGASLLLNHHIETDVINSKGKAYGIELLIKKPAGKFNGWLSYTFSRTFLKTDDPLAGQPVNNGSYYPADFDKPHSVNLIANYQFSHRISVSANVVYSTGRPITLPLAVFNIGGATSLYYSERNQYRIPDYFRSDLSINIDGNHRLKQKIHNSWSLGVYNLTAHQNAYSVYFTNNNGNVKGYELSIFGTAIPFITYNLKF
ncbi:MAG: carboxypeptidase-like regulatory domain-containing protein [Bacteroidetes bacterium]|nr:carboxypeptidase-like regulatory domain-containing protein [Bacteroidota bacterium]